MRLLVFIGVFFALYSCNNNLSTIGQDMINNTNHIELQTIQIEEVSTVKVDSFITSMGINYGNEINKLFMGKYEDEYSGTTRAVPCFQIAPTYQPNIATGAVLDSVTLNFTYAGEMWGDTLTDLRIQEFKLYQLKSLPELDYDESGYFYNTAQVNIQSDPLSSVVFYPRASNIKNAYFKLSESFGEELFQKMQYRDPIFQISANNPIPFINFLNYFKGLAIVPSESNNCIMSIRAVSDSLYLQFHYHEGNVQSSISLPLSQPEYMYNRIVTEPTGPFTELTDQEKQVYFEEADDIAIAQGLSGYMVKLTLPAPPLNRPYTTIIKAELTLKPKTFVDNIINYPRNLYVYQTNKINEIKGFLLNNPNNSSSTITGKYTQFDPNRANDRYVFDMTGYYQYLSANPPLQEKNEILLSIPYWTSNFDRMIVDELPLLKIYYAIYKE